MAVRFDKKWFNPLYFILNDLLKNESIRTILVYGGKSSAKTVSICQLLAKECYVKHSSTISFRKQSAIIPTTLKKSFNLAIDKMYLHPVFEKQDRRYLCSNRAEIVMKGLDDPEKAKGIESYKYVYLDELNHFEQEEYEQFNLSLRGIPGQKIFASWNPVDENSWVKKQLVDRYEFIETEYKLPCPESFVKISTCGKVVLIKTTYEDNYWIVGSPTMYNKDGSEIISPMDPRYKELHYGYRDQALIDQYEELKRINFASYCVNVLGLWGHKPVEKPFAFAFDEKKHCDPEKIKPYDPGQYLNLSFDFNVDPITCTASQHYGNAKYFLYEFRIQNSDIYELCDRIIAKYPNATKIITGDPTGRNRSALAKGNINYYTVIKSKLNLADGQMKQGTMNVSVADQRVLLNSMLQNYDVYFDKDGCQFLINDLKFLEVNGDGKREKAKEGQMGHLIDCCLYDLSTFHKDFLKRIGLAA